MDANMFFTSLLLTVGVVGAALLYLRAITRSVVTELCASEAGAEFWLRSADVLALAGSLMLVLAFGTSAAPTDWVQTVRLTLGLALAGLFVSVLFVANSIWRNVERVRSGAAGGTEEAALP